LTYPPGDRSIEYQAQTNFVKCISEPRKSLETRHISPLSPPLPPLPSEAYSRSSEPTNEKQIGVDLEGLIQSGNLTLKVRGLRKDSSDNSLSTLDLQLKADATPVEIMAAIKNAGASLTFLPIFFSPRLRRVL
jgi:hypothetical protein